ncbi:Crp/Fnr family transcriptional regulator [Acidovorax sp. FJL06]|uniref:Crp/Fnr family transcriptional regulator n=1 Tax=Acidovorax sp. FJL06 TaxID=2153365 RepID=UPI000F580597|nr:Crp/Fnr family transcriptional regulator [Acidovorax sp. FJL06]RQO79237.1 cyclic nucleotide-binding protein [Acidovorax sp. FJL06]
MKSEPLARSGGCTLCVGRQDCLLGRQNEERRNHWAPLVVERPMCKGELLLRQGETPHTFRIVKTGTVMLLCSGEDRVERPVGLFGPGQPLGTTGLVQQAAAVSCRALTAGRLCEVPIAAASQQGLLDAVFMRGLAQSYAQTNAWLAEWARIVRIRGVAGQLAATLLQLARIQRSSLVRLPSHVVLADLLSTTRETIARALRQLALQQGLVRHDRWHCEIQREVLLGLAGGHRPA